ncbi:hypothetical protein [Nitrosovibrio sp. Nv4]|uniref:hypothetical protein n=1 Tax=Nitrosovibrio sp. Nv4 TaxID=1945880 RepID=UPI000BD08B5A|nr:hypothetical protein [Nitrosovibrio sp. Nv4]SOD42277.1 hypothetical protein SAMN06298226_2613 [Nitrosovibrio sp. Nv4]
MRLIVAIFLMITFAGCTTTGPSQRPAGPLPTTTRPVYNLAGYSAAFKDGYIDGCETAKKTSYGFKDQRRFTADAQYRLGWKDGFSLCGRNRGGK